MTSASAEAWLPVVGYEGMYEVSDAGRVRGLPRSTAPGRMLTASVITGGYLAVKLSNRDHGITKRIHYLVTAAFIGPRPPGLVIRHLDGNCRNNHLSNLAYGTPSENVQDSLRHGTQAQARKTECVRGHSLTDPANVYRPPGRPSARKCVECLRIGSAKTEIRRAAERAAARAAASQVPRICTRGHEISGENLYSPPGKPRQKRCRECRRLQHRKLTARRAEQAATRRSSHSLEGADR